jgi:CubicO group peptidase (beta-lactamase class C family)
VRLFVGQHEWDYHRRMRAKLTVGFIVTLLAAKEAMASESDEFVKAVEAALPPHVGACVMGIDHGDIVFQYANGLADIEGKTRCTPATNFRMASVSKQFTATAVMLLVDRGKLALDDTLKKFFPGFPDYGSKITVKHLLTHTAGLPAYEDLIPSGTALQLDDLDALHLLMDSRVPKFAPGEKFEYSNSGYALLGLIVEVASQKPFHEFMASEIFRPLGMNDSVLYQRGLNAIPHRAFGHERKDGDWVRADQSLTSAIRGDGAVYTSLRDYRKWLGGIERRKLLSQTSYDAMFSPQVMTDRHGSRYGFGWFIDAYRGEPRIHHNGETRGFRLCAQRFPKRQAAVVLQLNNEIEGPSEELTKIGERLADILIFERNRTGEGKD